jgi:hypothetical protein
MAPTPQQTERPTQAAAGQPPTTWPNIRAMLAKRPPADLRTFDGLNRFFIAASFRFSEIASAAGVAIDPALVDEMRTMSQNAWFMGAISRCLINTLKVSANVTGDTDRPPADYPPDKQLVALTSSDTGEHLADLTTKGRLRWPEMHEKCMPLVLGCLAILLAEQDASAAKLAADREAAAEQRKRQAAGVKEPAEFPAKPANRETVMPAQKAAENATDPPHLEPDRVVEYKDHVSTEPYRHAGEPSRHPGDKDPGRGTIDDI